MADVQINSNYVNLGFSHSRRFGGNVVIRFIRSSVWPTVPAKKLVFIDGKLLEDLNGPKILPPIIDLKSHNVVICCQKVA